MANKNLLQKFTKSILPTKKASALKGGRNYEPNNSGSYGWVNWDDVDIRTPGLIAGNAKLTKKNSIGFN